MSGNPSEEFADVALRLRLEAGLSQAELAKRANVNPTTVREMESGKKPGPPWPPTYRQLRAFYRTELGEPAAKSWQAAWIAWKLRERANRRAGASTTEEAQRETLASTRGAETQESATSPAMQPSMSGMPTEPAGEGAGDDAGTGPPAAEPDSSPTPATPVADRQMHAEDSTAGPAIRLASPAGEESAHVATESPTRRGTLDHRGRQSRKWIPFVLVGLVLIVFSATFFAINRIILPFHQRRPPSTSSAPVRIEGNLAAAVQLGAHSTGLGFIDPATGAVLSLPLVPEEQSQMRSYIDPAYSPSHQLLAFIAIAADGTHSVWVARLRVTPSSAPQIVKPGPLKLVANCGQHCNTLTFAPSGNWLIVEGSDGLIAVNTQTGEQRAITHGSHDAWPACSPNGAWLTYQYGVETAGYIVAVPAVDCLPIAGAAGRSRVLSGYILAWHPAWSVDGTHVAFMVESPKGTRVYMVDVSSLTRGGSVSDAQLSPQPISENGCGDPVWATVAQAPQNVLLYTCSGQSGSHLVVASGSDLSRQQVVAGGPNVAEPRLVNPAWIPPETT